MGLSAAGGRGEAALPVCGYTPGNRVGEFGGSHGTAAEEWRRRLPRLGGMTAGMAPAASGKTRYHGSSIDSRSRCGILGCGGVSGRYHEVFQDAAAARAVVRG
jgi:hypothetical protein